MKNLAKILTFIGITGAAVAGLWYFLNTTKKPIEECCNCDEESEPEKDLERSYVSLDADAEKSDKETLEKVVKSAVDESIAKAEEMADGVGLVKGESEASDFEFKSFDEE